MLERIGNCRIVEEMASGGMAVVYRAIQDDLNRTVAIKALKSSAAAEEQMVLRFEREAQSLAALQHENIIHVYDFHRQHGALFIVMEYVEGIDLYDLLDRCGRLPYDVAAVISMQVARALDYIHFRSILHRDIKPANIMLSRQGAVKLMDFGIAQDSHFKEDLTEMGTGLGTPAYMSPEQIVGDRLDGRSDIFSLGMVLYQMVTGRKAFIADDQKSVMQKIRLDSYVPIRQLNPDIPRGLERIIDKCLHKDPRDRWRSAQLLVMALERFLAKHVEMNHHARLVLFLKDQEIITQYEAEEYLNPTLTGQVTSMGPDLVARRQLVRRSLVFHCVILAVVSLMVGIIHLAPVGSSPQVVIRPPEHGYVRVLVRPWGHIAVDGESVGTTPMAAPLELTVGPHTLKITNDFLPPLERQIEVDKGEESDPTFIKIDLEAARDAGGMDAIEFDDEAAKSDKSRGSGKAATPKAGKKPKTAPAKGNAKTKARQK